MLCSGQALFVSPAGYWQRVKFDAEMANYAQFENQILPILDDLALAGIPVIYVTGDVHWGRVAQAVDVRNQAPMLYEVITSPSALVRAPLVDRVKELEAGFGGMFAAPDPWPRHGAPDPVPERLGKAGHFRLLCDPGRQSGLMQRGNQVAVLSFARAGPRLDFKADYFPISSDKALAQPRSTRTFQLHNY
jgi:hypothetical protein